MPNPRISLVALVGALLLAPFVVCAAAADAPLSPAQTLNRYQIGDLRFSPDGTRVAFTVGEPVKGATRKTNIWMLDVAAKRARRFTSGPKSDTSPRWSPDGRSLAFLSDREEGETQIYVMRADGGEAAKLTTAKQSIQAFDWSPDGKRIAFLARVPKTEDQEKKEKERDDARVIDDAVNRVQVWVVDVEGGRVSQLTRGAFAARSVQWHPDGARLVVVAKDPPESEEWSERIAAITAADGSLSVIAAPKGPIGSVLLSPDGRSVAWTGARVDGPSAHDLYVAPSSGGAARNLTGASLDRPVGQYAWRLDGTLVGVVAQGFSSALVTIRPDGTTSPIALPVLPSAFAVSSAGATVVVGQTATHLPELYLSSAAGGAMEQVTDFHAAWAKIPILATRPFHYKSFDGLDIEAALLTPPDAVPGRRLPLVVLVHGGPTGRWTTGFEPWGQMLAARGFAVLYPNIRGSVGYGHAFIESNRADWGGGDFKDVMAGVDAVIAQGIADPQRLGIGGWSYGGYMAAWAITQTNRFKGSVSGACMSDLASEFGTENGSAGDEWFYGTPYERQADFIKSSPITFIKNAKTPTLILQGESDTTDPIGQSQQLHRGLKHYDVPVEFVVYPREPHGLREEKHQVDMLGRLLGWFERYVKPEGR
jgi:dipeptidyl aminopeptidase/acylaminoacyl peptidase